MASGSDRRILNLPLIASGNVVSTIVLPLDDPSDNLTKKINLGQIKDFVLSGASNLNYYTTGATYSNGIIYFNRNDQLSAYTVNISSLTGDSNTFITAATYNDLTNTITLTDNTNNSFNVYINGFSGLTADNLTATTIVNTYLDSFYIRDNGGTLSIDNTTRKLLKSDGSTTSFDWENGILTGQTNIESTTISATTYQNLPLGVYGTGLTFNTGNYDLTLDGGNGSLETISLSILASDLTVTGGTYNSNTGVATFTNNTGGTFNVSGFLTGFTDINVTGATYNNNTFTFTNTSGGSFNVGFNSVTGLTSTGTLSSNTISATTYQNLPVSGLTAGTNIGLTNNNGNYTINVTGVTGGSFTGGTVSGPTNFTGGLSANTISATTYQNLPSVIQVSCSDEVTALITGTTTTFRMPYSMLVTEVRGSLTTAQTSGSTFTVDILRTGTTILSTLLTIDSNQKTSKAIGTTQPVISTPNLLDDDEMSVKITQIGSGTARGLKIAIIGNRTT